MKNKNICRFVEGSAKQGLNIINFVYETNREIMECKKRLEADMMILVTGGTGRIWFDGEEWSLSSGNLVVGFSGEEYRVDLWNQLEYMYITFSGYRAEELFHRFGIHFACRLYHGFEGLVPLWKNSLACTPEENIDLIAESILLHTFSRFDESVSRGNVLIGRIVELTETQFADADLTLTAVSQQLGYNSKYISHVFKEKMGISYSEYLRNMRIRYAVSLFEHGIDSVKSVAYLSGFRDPLYFSTVFKKAVGKAPSDYRRNP